MLSYFSWLYKQGVRRDPVFKGLVWRVSAEKQREVMSLIREQIIPSRGVRVTTGSIENFPKLDIACQLVDIEDVEKLNKNYETLEYALETLRTRASADVAPESPITTILRCRQRLELLKIGAAVELAEDRLAQGYSVGLFVNFRQTVIELSQRLGCDYIDGTVTGAKRDAIIADYQANKTRALVLNSEACGVCIGLQDLDGNFPRFGIVSPPWSATVFKQLIGRFPRDRGKSKSHYRVLFAAGTIEMRMHAALKAKLDNLDSLTDADMQPENLKL